MPVFHRLLNVGEPILSGDEFLLISSGTWHPIERTSGCLVSTTSPPIRRPLPSFAKLAAVIGPFVQLACEVERKQSYFMTQYGEAKVDTGDLDRLLKFHESITPNPLVVHEM